MPADPSEWLDREAGPVVRPYAVTQGRVAPSATEFDLVAHVVATEPGAPHPAELQPEHRALIDACWEPVSVVELAARTDLSLGVVRVLLGDLRSSGLVALYEPPAAEAGHDLDVLKAVVNGLRAL